MAPIIFKIQYIKRFKAIFLEWCLKVNQANKQYGVRRTKIIQSYGHGETLLLGVVSNSSKFRGLISTYIIFNLLGFVPLVSGIKVSN